MHGKYVRSGWSFANSMGQMGHMEPHSPRLSQVWAIVAVLHGVMVHDILKYVCARASVQLKCGTAGLSGLLHLELHMT